MNGGHDLGGMHGLGPINPEHDEPVFHADWERRAFALTVACGFGGLWNIDMARYARESVHPKQYLETTYYEKWLLGLQQLLTEHGVLNEAEIELRMRALASEEAKP